VVFLGFRQPPIVVGALNTMYGAVPGRTPEIATLRALGFGAGPVVVSVLIESVLLSLLDGMLGAATAYVFFDGYRTSTINWQTFRQVTFAFKVTPELLGKAIGYATLMRLGPLVPVHAPPPCAHRNPDHLLYLHRRRRPAAHPQRPLRPPHHRHRQGTPTAYHHLRQNHPHLSQNQDPLVTTSPHIPVVEYNLTPTTLANHQHPIESIACQPRD
jgi:hypothetical protein